MRPDRASTLTLIAFGTAFGLLACFRLISVVYGVPRPLWLVELPSKSPQGLTVRQEIRQHAARLSLVVRDAQLAPSLFAACSESARKGSREEGVSSLSIKTCGDVVDYGLAASPTSSELWLIKARLSASSGNKDQDLFVSLRKSYRTGAREGWIASSRVVTALRIYDQLPAELKRWAYNDLRLVVTDEHLARPLATAYIDDAALRQTLSPLLQNIPLQDLGPFFAAVRNELNTAASPK